MTHTSVVSRTGANREEPQRGGNLAGALLYSQHTQGRENMNQYTQDMLDGADLDDPDQIPMLMGDLATHYGWTGGVISRAGGGWIAVYRQPSGLELTLVFENHILTKALRGTRVSKLEASGDMWSMPEMVKIAAMWLEDNE